MILSGVLALLLAAPGAGHARHLTVLFDGDNGGEVLTCGCSRELEGGLARRVTLVEQVAHGGPTLVLAAGNELYASEAAPTAKQRARAELILEVLGQTHVAGLAVGARELSGGVEKLVAAAQHAKVPLLSANLMRDGRPVFDASRVVSVGGLKVGLVGVSPEGKFPGALGVAGRKATEVVPGLLHALRAKTDVVFVLAAAPLNEVLALRQAVGADADFFVFSHDARGTGVPLGGAPSTLLFSGDRGRALGVLELDVRGKGPASFVNLDAAKQATPDASLEPPRAFSVAYRGLTHEVREEPRVLGRAQALDPKLDGTERRRP